MSDNEVGKAPEFTARELEANEKQEKIERILSPLLLTGVLLSSGLMIFGLILDVVEGKSVATAVPRFHELIPYTVRLRPSGLLALGLLMLIATPILRVITSIIAFLFERDWFYAFITFVVFAIVMTSIFLGRG